MYKSKLFSLTLVLLLQIAASAFAVDYTFDNGGGSDNYWRSPANWSPDGVPTGSDTAAIPTTLTCEINDPDAGGGGDGAANVITVYNLSVLDMTGGVVNATTLKVGSGGTAEQVGTFNMTGGVFNGNLSGAPAGSGLMNISGDAEFNVAGSNTWLLYSSLAGFDFTQNIFGNAVFNANNGGVHLVGRKDTATVNVYGYATYTTNKRFDMGGDVGGSAILNVSGNASFTVNNKIETINHVDAADCSITVSDSASLYVQTNIQLGLQSGATMQTSTLTINDDAVVTCGANFLVGQRSAGLLIMNGGTLRTAQLNIPYPYTAGSGHVQFNGGTAYVTSNFSIKSSDGSMDFAGGMLVINGDHTAEFEGYFDPADGRMTYYNGLYGRDKAILHMDYSQTYHAKTTVWAAAPTDPNTAWYPRPRDRALIEAAEPNLMWAASNDAVKHDIYLADSFDDVNTATIETADVYKVRQNNNAGDPNHNQYTGTEALRYGTTYYWRIDEVEADDTIHKGKIWRFKTACPAGDITGDCKVDTADLLKMASEWAK